MSDMRLIQSWLASQDPATDRPLRCFVLADPALDAGVVRRLKQTGDAWVPLLKDQGAAVAAQGPHLFDIGPVRADVPPPDHVARLAQSSPAAVTWIASPVGLTDLYAHLTSFLDVQLEGGLKLALAFWDPAILGTLVGQADDATLHVPGPALDPGQLHALLAPIAAWWYRDREGNPHRIDPPTSDAGAADFTPPLALTQAQEDLLVEASVPDQILYHLELNQPHLFDRQLPAARRYRFVRAVLGPARELGLEGMRDLVNFTALCLIYRQRMQTDETIAGLLDQVRLKALTMDEALELMPA